MHFVSRSPSIKLKTYMLEMRKIRSTKETQKQINPLMSVRKERKILSPPCDALSYAAVMRKVGDGQSMSFGEQTP
jgi:hypothetical protein